MSCANSNCLKDLKEINACPHCALFNYCSEECRLSHWSKVHQFSCTHNQRQSLRDLEDTTSNSLRLLGKGSYGEVKLVKSKKNNHLYALKSISKSILRGNYSLMMLLREINIHKSLKHPNIIELIDHFENDRFVFILLDYAPGGNLFNLIRSNQGLPEERAWKYFTQTCTGLKYLHDHQIIHRDLKPENLLLSQKDNVKICDFGWCVKSNQTRTTYCGTLDYMAPEMLLERGHSFQVDLWAMGVLLYELLHGYPPFRSMDATEKRRQILKSELDFADDIDKDAQDLIKRLIKFRPEDRISINEILTHKWIQKYAKTENLNINQAVKHDSFGKGRIIQIQGLLCTINYGENIMNQYLSVSDLYLSVDLINEEDKEKILLEKFQKWCNKPYKFKGTRKVRKKRQKHMSLSTETRATTENSLLETELVSNKTLASSSIIVPYKKSSNHSLDNFSFNSRNSGPKPHPSQSHARGTSKTLIKIKEEELKSLVNSIEGRPSRYSKNHELPISKEIKAEKKGGFVNWVSGLFGCGDR